MLYYSLHYDILQYATLYFEHSIYSVYNTVYVHDIRYTYVCVYIYIYIERERDNIVYMHSICSTIEGSGHCVFNLAGRPSEKGTNGVDTNNDIL